MESLDELEHPLLGRESPKADPRGLGTTCTTNRLFNGVLMRCEEDKTLPPLGWRVYCGGAGEPAPGELGYQQAQQQLLDPCSLPSTLETLYPPAPLWGHPDAMGLGNKDYLETTFVDIYPESPLERKLFAESEQDIHSVFYSLEDEDDLLPDYEVRKDPIVARSVGHGVCNAKGCGFDFCWGPPIHNLCMKVPLDKVHLLNAVYYIAQQKYNTTCWFHEQ